MKYLIGLVLVLVLLMAVNCFAETYTGRAEGIRATDRGISFTIVITDSKNAEVLRREQWVSTGIMTGEEASQAIKNVVDRFTQEIYAHIEGGKIVEQDKTILENYRSTCNTFIVPELRPNPQTIRTE